MLVSSIGGNGLTLAIRFLFCYFVQLRIAKVNPFPPIDETSTCVLHTISRDVDLRLAALREQQAHNHALRNDVRAIDQLTRVVEHAVDGRARIRITGILNAQKLLTVMLLDLETLAEERHLRFDLLKADSVTESRLRIKRRRLEHDRQTLAALEPFQVKSGALLGREQAGTEVRDLVARSLRPAGGDNVRGEKINNVHGLPPSNVFAADDTRKHGQKVAGGIAHAAVRGRLGVYKDIEGKWSNDLPYVIVHRLAIADEMKRQGMAKQFMLQAEEVSRKKGVYNFRVDTKYDNAYMLRLIDTLGFKYCGEVYYRNNSARKAFEKTIRPYSHPIGISDYTIREATFEDATLIFEAIDKNREDLRIWLPFIDGLKSVADEQGFLQSVLAVPYEQRDPVYILEQGEAICGLAGFHFSDAPNRRTEIGYWLLPAYRGKGIVTNTVRYLCQWAVRERNMNRIQIRCAVGNIPSNAVPKRLGFTLEGTEREGELLTSGEYVNVNVYSILKKEIEQWNRKSN